MATRIYLEGDKVRGLQGFLEKPVSNGTLYWFYEHHLTLDGGVWYYELSDGDEPIPALSELARRVSVRISISSNPTRECGLYVYAETTRGELVKDAHSGVLYLTVTSEKLENARALVGHIRAGTIHPETSFDLPTGGKSRDELEKEIAKLRTDLQSACQETDHWRDLYANADSRAASAARDHETVLRGERERAGRLERQLNAVVTECNCLIDEGGWPFCHQATLACEIKRVALWSPNDPSTVGPLGLCL